MHLPLRLLSTIFVSVLMAIGIVFNAVIADTVTVWKWIDAEGKVVYSQHPPPGKVKAEEKHIDPNRNVIESGWRSAPSSEERSARRSRSRRIARQGGGAATEEPPGPPAVTPSPAVPSPPPALAPPPVAPPAPPAAPAVPSPGPGGF